MSPDGDRPAPDNARQRMQQNAAQQAEVLGQDPGGADREALLAARLREKITSGLLGERTTHPDAQWFGRSPLGLFIHWGIPSVDGNFDLSWSMVANLGHDAKTTPRHYWSLADRFRAENYDPVKWLSAAKASGFDYAVLTTKHHDGYTLFPTETTDLGVRTHLQGRDLVGDYVAACRSNGMKVGLYFSGVDWWLDKAYRNFNYRSPGGIGNSSLPSIPGRVAFDMDHLPWTPPAVPAALLEENKLRCRQQLIELLTRYGRIDVLWFDGGCGSDLSIEEIRALQPGILVNNRGNCRWQSAAGGRVFPGDFHTVEFGEAPEKPPGWWEQLRIWNEPCWGYTRSNETHYAPAAEIAAQIRRTRAWSGAYLLNVGPRSDGTLPDPYYRGLEELRTLGVT